MKIYQLLHTFGVLAILTLLPTLAFANEPPAAQPLNKTLKEDKTIKIALKGADPEHKKLTFAITQPQHGGVTLKGSDVTYKPVLNYNGSDSFQYTTSDGELTSVPATVSLNVQAVNDTPVPLSQTLTVQKGATAKIVLKASDVENNPLSYLISAKPKKGKIGKPNGNVVIYTPNPAKKKKPAFSGKDSFSIKVKDGKKSSKAVKIKLTVSDTCPIGQEFKNGVCFVACELPTILENGLCVGPPDGYEALSVTKTGKGFVNSTPAGIECGETCAAFFPEKSVITLTATPDANSSFTGWSGGCSGIDATCSFTINSGTKKFTEIKAEFTPRFNDTGITNCSDTSANGLSCPLTAFPGQDGDFGRDKNFPNDTNGHAGFNFTKIGSNGQPLAIQNASWSDTGSETTGTLWSCVKDNVTGLFWEVKTNSNANDTYTWQDASAPVQTANAAGLCGHNDWRVPTRQELTSLVDFGRATSPAIDTAYFAIKSAQSAFFWSSSAFAGDSGNAWSVSADKGASDINPKSNKFSIRLVRSGQ